METSPRTKLGRKVYGGKIPNPEIEEIRGVRQFAPLARAEAEGHKDEKPYPS